MSLLLNIDTAIGTASVSIAKDGHIIQEAVNTDQRDHAAFLQPAIQSIFKNAGLSLHELDAIAIVAGPGSYTGLRVGMASAKGLCFALNKPLITIGTLEMMAWQAINQFNIKHSDLPVLFCPMVDARRMEVFTAIYSKALNIILSPCAIVIEKKSFGNLLLKNKIIFFGNGAIKWQPLCDNENALFFDSKINPLYMSELTFKKYLNNDFSNTAYTEPLYIKEFFVSQL